MKVASLAWSGAEGAFLQVSRKAIGNGAKITMRTFLCLGLLVLLGSTSSASAKPKPTKAPSAGALTGTVEVGKPTKPTSASGLVQAWQTFKGANVELALPATYRGGSPDTQGMQRLLADIKSLGAEYEQIARMVEQNPETFVLIAVDPTPDPTGGITNVVVSAIKVPETVTAEAYIDAAMQSLPIPTRTVERQTVQVGKQPAVRLVTEASIAPGKAQADQVRQLIYVIKQENTLWTVTYSTRATDYPQRVALFEQSIESFKVRSTTSPQPGSSKTPGTSSPNQPKPVKPKPLKQ